MARPNKKGLSYYNIDTDRYQDIRIKRLKHSFGVAGISVYDYLLCEIYRVKGCFIEWDESTAFDVTEYFGLKETTVKEIVLYCGTVGLFDKELLSIGTLTSLSIQSRYIEICKRAKRTDSFIPEKVKLPHVITNTCHVITPKTQEEVHKVKYSKVNESKEKESEVLPELSIEFLKENFNSDFNFKICRDHKISEEKNWEMQDVFFKEIDRKEKYLEYKNVRDCRSHYDSWLKIELEKEKNYAKKENGKFTSPAESISKF